MLHHDLQVQIRKQHKRMRKIFTDYGQGLTQDAVSLREEERRRGAGHGDEGNWRRRSGKKCPVRDYVTAITEAQTKEPQGATGRASRKKA